MKAYVSSFLSLAVALMLQISLNAGEIFLTGAQLYAASSTGGIRSPLDSFRYSTNNKDTAAILRVSAGLGIPRGTPQDRSISLALLTGGSTTLSFSTIETSAPATDEFLGLNLFFSATDASYNPESSGEVIAGDLSVERSLGSSTAFGIPNSDKFVQNYAANAPSNKPNASGRQFFTVGGYDVRVTAFTASIYAGPDDPDHQLVQNAIVGSFTLTVTATPEPATLGMGALGMCGIAAYIRRRLTRAQART